MRLSLLLGTLFLGGAIAVPITDSNDLTAEHDARSDTSSASCGHWTSDSGDQTLTGAGKCVAGGGPMHAYDINSGCLCKFYTSPGCGGRPIGGAKEGPAQGDLPEGVEWYACRYAR